MSGLYPQYAPEFQLQINGAAIPTALRGSITSVRVEDGVPSMLGGGAESDAVGADRLEVEFANGDLRWLERHIRGLGFRPFPTALKLGPTRIRPTPAFSLNPAAGLSQLPLAEAPPDGLFDIDNRVTLDMGYAPGRLDRLFLGEITGVEADFPSGGMPTMRVVAHDYLHRLADGQLARNFGPLPDFLIAALLGAENLLIPLIDPVVGAASIALRVLGEIFHKVRTRQFGQTDLDLLRQIAATYDADYWVEGNVLYLSRVLGKEYTPQLTLRWGESLLSFAPKVSMIGNVIGAAITFKLDMLPLSFVLAVAWDFDRESLSVRVLPGATAISDKTLLGGPMISLVNQKIANAADITNSVLSLVRLLRSKLNSRLTGHGEAVGDPRIRAGAIICLDGLGPTFSGNYRVTSATHSIGAGGYRTAFQVRKEIIP